ncbi:ABC-type lipoprotein export system, ATPase component [Ruminococcaceae bacterium YRB3002]|nr:ABC-type lipoprotein export system, ATPase component [Ruminococcaceae bacterium YRB3002]
MAISKKFISASWKMMEQLLNGDDIDEALSGTLETMVSVLNSEAGAIWLLDKESDRLYPVCNIGAEDITNVSIENGVGIEGGVSKTGKSVMITDASRDSSFDGSTLDDYGITTRSMICVPLNNIREVIGCIQIINKLDGSLYDQEELELCEHMAALAAMTIDEKGLKIDAGERKKVIVSLRGITKEYTNGDSVLRVLKGINLDVYANEFVVVLGESGCGKSTMMNIIGGMDYATGGELYIDGKDFSHPTELDLTKFRRNYVGFIFQSYNLMPNLSALENIEYIAELVDDPMSSKDALDKVGLGERAGNFPKQMSGGQQQRVSIARAIVKKPKLILADEPTAALDYTTSIEVLDVIEDIVKTQGTTVMMITHNPEIAKMADRVIKVRGGKIASIKRNLRPLHAVDLVW